MRKIIALSLTLTACGPVERIQPIFPPAADLIAATEPKPVPSADIVTSALAAAEYDIALEAWGDRLRAAGVRLCVWTVANGNKIRCDGQR